MQMLSLNELNFLLKSHSCDLRVGLKEYEVDFYNKMSACHYLNDGENVIQESQWKLGYSIAKFNKNTVEITLKAACTKGGLQNASFFAELNLSNWEKSNHLLMPAVCYNGNRYESRPQQYMPFFYEFEDMTSDEKVLLSDVPRLSNGTGVSKIDERTGSFSSPIVAYYHPNTNNSVLFSCNIIENENDSGICFEEAKNKKHARLTLTNPVVREVHQYRMTNTHFPSQDSPTNYNEGDSIVLTFRLQFESCQSVAQLYQQVNDIEKWWAKDEDLPPMHNVSYSKAFAEIERKFNTSNFSKEHGYYAVGLRENAFQDWQLGWTGGLISTLPLFVAGGQESRQRVYQTFEWFFENAIAPSGLFWGIGENGNSFFGEFEKTKPLGKDLLLVRKMADAIYYITKHFILFEKAGLEVKDEWKEKLQKAIGVIIEVWETNKQLGHYLHIHTKKIMVGGSTSGGLMSAALCIASEYFNKQKYLEAAFEMAEYFYKNYVSKGLAYGGVGDAMHNFDSESCYGLLESFAMLSEKTNDEIWIERTETAACLFNTWVATYSYSFPEKTLFGKLKMDTKGTVFANTQNKHLAPGICTYSGVALLRHYRKTRKLKWLCLLQNIVRAIPSYLSYPERRIGNMQDGWISERINSTDWWEPIGEIFEGSTWSETSCMLSRVEVPGVYVVSDLGLAIAFDLVKAELKGLHSLVLTNYQDYDIKVTVLIENSSAFSQPFQVSAFQEALHFELKANSVLKYEIEN